MCFNYHTGAVFPEGICVLIVVCYIHRHMSKNPSKEKHSSIPGDFQGEVGSGPGESDLAVVSLVTAGELEETSEGCVVQL